MTHTFDPGPVGEPYASLIGAYPGPDVYPPDSFRVEWGPIFHRGRLDGSARLLVIGQDPAQSEAIVRRILVGAAGHRTQGLMAKLGFDQSYVLINTFLYSVYGQTGGEQHKDDQGIVDYRNSWLGAILGANQIEAVLALGGLADDAWQKWKQTPGAQGHSPPYQRVTHPDVPGPLVPYGDAFKPEELVEIPEFDVPAGLPEWMRSPAAWAQRVGATPAAKRADITITIPPGVLTS